jgi:hypothetical protein
MRSATRCCLPFHSVFLYQNCAVLKTPAINVTRMLLMHIAYVSLISFTRPQSSCISINQIFCSRRRLPEASRAAGESGSGTGASLLHIMSTSSCSVSCINILDELIFPLSNFIRSPLPSKSKNTVVIQPNEKATPVLRLPLNRLSTPTMDEFSSLSPLPMHLDHLKVDRSISALCIIIIFLPSLLSLFHCIQNFLEKFRRAPPFVLTALFEHALS